MTGPRLQIESGNDRGREVDLSRTVVIGRSAGCDLVLDDDSCSRMHVRLRPNGEHCQIEDLNSTNGTFINGERVAAGVLRDGDVFTVGGTSIRLRWPTFDSNATVILEAAVRDEAQILDRFDPHRVPGPVVGEEAERLVEVLGALLDATRGMPDTHAIARALCDAAKRFLPGERAACLVYRSGVADAGAVVSTSSLRLDPGRPWIHSAIRERRALLLEDQRNGKSLAALVVPLFRGTLPLAVLYVDRRKSAIASDEVARLLRVTGAAEALLQTADLHERLRTEFQENRVRVEGERRIVGASPAHDEVMAAVRRAASGSHPVLLIGETGTGKELLARHLHEVSPRAEGPLLVVNCSATPEEFLEAQIFGGTKAGGAATLGGLERARGGTLFVDEIDALDLACQARLAAVLRDRRLLRPWDGREVPLDVRLVAASDRDLAERAQNGGFHQDLLALLALGTITVPPLRDRAEDIPLLADHFLKQHARRMNRRARRLSADALNALVHYQWPGNVRELSNVIERAVMLATEEEIPAKLLPFPLDPSDLLIANVEKLAIERALQFCHYRKGKAASALGISWPTLNKKIHDYGIQVPGKG